MSTAQSLWQSWPGLRQTCWTSSDPNSFILVSCAANIQQASFHVQSCSFGSSTGFPLGQYGLICWRIATVPSIFVDMVLITTANVGCHYFPCSTMLLAQSRLKLRKLWNHVIVLYWEIMITSFLWLQKSVITAYALLIVVTLRLSCVAWVSNSFVPTVNTTWYSYCRMTQLWIFNLAVILHRGARSCAVYCNWEVRGILNTNCGGARGA